MEGTEELIPNSIKWLIQNRMEEWKLESKGVILIRSFSSNQAKSSAKHMSLTVANFNTAS